MEKYCVNLGIANQLMDLGFPQNTEFFWFHSNISTFQLFSKKEVENIITKYKLDTDNYQAIAAPSVGELGEWLPPRKKYWTEEQTEGKWSNDWICLERITVGVNGRTFVISYSGDSDEIFRHEDDNEANARAKMLIYLATHSLLNPKTL